MAAAIAINLMNGSNAVTMVVRTNPNVTRAAADIPLNARIPANRIMRSAGMVFITPKCIRRTVADTLAANRNKTENAINVGPIAAAIFAQNTMLSFVS